MSAWRSAPIRHFGTVAFAARQPGSRKGTSLLGAELRDALKIEVQSVAGAAAITVTRGQRVRPAGALERGHIFHYPTVEDALEDLIYRCRDTHRVPRHLLPVCGGPGGLGRTSSARSGIVAASDQPTGNEAALAAVANAHLVWGVCSV